MTLKPIDPTDIEAVEKRFAEWDEDMAEEAEEQGLSIAEANPMLNSIYLRRFGVTLDDILDEMKKDEKDEEDEED